MRVLLGTTERPRLVARDPRSCKKNKRETSIKQKTLGAAIYIFEFASRSKSVPYYGCSRGGGVGDGMRSSGFETAPRFAPVRRHCVRPAASVVLRVRCSVLSIWRRQLPPELGNRTHYHPYRCSNPPESIAPRFRHGPIPRP